MWNPATDIEYVKTENYLSRVCAYCVYILDVYNILYGKLSSIYVNNTAE